MNILTLGIALGLLLGLIMVITLIMHALKDRRRNHEPDDQDVDRTPSVDEQAAPKKRALAMNREDIWNRGCRGELLGDAEQDEFAYLARARFYTFQLGIRHAGGDDEKSSLLIRGLAVELASSPGLERLWYQSSASEDPSGQAVSAQLADIQSPGSGNRDGAV